MRARFSRDARYIDIENNSVTTSYRVKVICMDYGHKQSYRRLLKSFHGRTRRPYL